MKERIKLWLRRLALRCLRNLVDVADDRLHTAEVKLREDLSGRSLVRVVASTPQQVGSIPAPRSKNETFVQWEARRSGVAPVSKKTARRRRERVTASAFDLRFAR
jgi:uncharacterized protein YmfQ (DUF2313 family)